MITNLSENTACDSNRGCDNTTINIAAMAAVEIIVVARVIFGVFIGVVIKKTWLQAVVE